MTTNKLPKTTTKQHQIQKLTYRFRFLNTLQIQKFLNHKNNRRVKEWLKDLREKNYLEWIYSTKFEQKSKHAIYYTGLNGIRWLKTQEDCTPEVIRKLYRDGKIEKPFIERSILIGDICLNLTKESNKTESFSLATASDYAHQNTLFHFLTELKDHAPDLCISDQIGKNVIYYLLSMIDPTLPRYKIRSRVGQYVNFYYSNTWEDHTHKPFPIFLIVALEKSDLIYAKRYAKKVLEQNQNPKDLHIAFAMADEVKQFGINSNIWEEA